ncbi:MAG: hypothetical protein CNIPEHKO_00143 [Anaerolineales bacterium]|nr:hypothetical protein [Anaerolineales bacterium]
MTNTFIPRPSQQQILRYNGGRLGIAAVPGAGKTHILSALAAQIIHSGAPDERRDNDMLHLLDVLTGDDFEAVDASVLMVDVDSGEAK